MRYLKVKWTQDSPDFPVLLFSELDDESWEVRKVDIYADGRMDFADGKEQTGTTDLGLVPTPPIEEIAADPEFDPVMISAGEFEVVWRLARAKHHGARQ